MAAFLAVVALPVGAMAAFSNNLLENPTFSHQNAGIQYMEQSVDEGGEQKLFYGEYNTTSADAEYEWVIHSVRKGTSTTLTTVMDIAKDYEKKTGKKAIIETTGEAAPYNGTVSHSVNIDKAAELGFQFSNIEEWIFELIDEYIGLCIC